MDAAVGDRWVALAAVVAALAPALSGAAGLVTLTQWDPGTRTLVGGAVVGGLAAALLAWVAWRRDDHTSLGFALSSLCFALSWIPLGALSFPVSTILSIAAKGLLITFGIMVLRRSTGSARVAGWAITIAAVVWLLGGLSLWFGTLPHTTQTTLEVLFTVPAAAQVVAFLVAALLFTGPFLRPVRTGARYLWSTADVR